MKKTKKISLVLIISILISMFTLPDISLVTVKAEDDSEMYYEKGYFPVFYDENNKNTFESINSTLPPGTPSTITVNGSVFPFNYRLWFAKNIVVYGDYSTANSRSNDFKAETDSPYGVGFYSKNGVRGEYRYHGFDVAGNRYNNTWWTIDVNTGSSINDNVWLYRPWSKDTYNLEKISPYNEAAEWPRNQEDQKTKAWINRPIQKDGITLTFENAENNSEREAYRYINIMSAPTINYPGEARAWYKYNNQLLYRTFTIDKLDHVDKLMTDVATSVKILTPENRLAIKDFGSGSSGNTLEYLDSEIEVEVEVSGVLLDEEYYKDPVKKTARYTREDIKDWTISLGSDIRGSVKSVDYNKGKAIFILKYKVASILAQNTYTLKGNTRVNFKNDKSNENTGSTNLVFKIENKIPSVLIKDKQMTAVSSAFDVLASPEVLTVLDYGENNTQEYLNGIVFVPVRVTGTLMDTIFYNNPEEREKRYNRDDIHSWTMSLNETTYPNIAPDDSGPSGSYKNKKDAIITLWFKRSEIFQRQTWKLNAYSEALFLDGKSSKRNATGTLLFTIKAAPQNQEPPQEPPPEAIEEPPPPPVIIEPDCHIPHPGFDIVPYPAYDNTDLSQVLSRKVYINGDEVDDVEFFSGNYIFGDGNDGIKKIDVIYESMDEITSSTTQWAYIYDTKPTAQYKLEGAFKENRKLLASENCASGNTQIVLDKYPIVSYNWKFISIDGESSSLKQRTPTSDKYREFLYKKPGVYRLELTVTNTLGRVSKPYTLDFVIYEDTPPAIEMNIWNGVLTRGEELKLHYSASSVDNDSIALKTLQLYYDSNNDGECDQLVKTFPDGEFAGYAPDKLGKYRLVATATEEFGQETLPEYTTVADKKKKTAESEFWVDNLVPMTDIYVNVPVVKPEIDLYVMMDKNLNESIKQYITANRINFNNFLRTKNILPKVETWDMKTYEYSQSVSDTYRSGESYPPSSILYSSGGYSGTLYLEPDSTVDNGEDRDFGSWDTKTESKEFTRSHSNTITEEWWDGSLYRTTESDPEPSSYDVDEDGYSGSIPQVSRDGPYNRKVDNYYSDREFIIHHSNTVTDCYNDGKLVYSSNSDPAPSSYYINEDGYSGYIYRDDTEGPYNEKHWFEGQYEYYEKTWVAVFRGTLSKIHAWDIHETYISTYRGTLTKSKQVWVPDMRWVSDYIGYYSGIVYKYVRQPYSNPFRATSDKYVVYISDGNINELTDLGMVMSKADARLILVGANSIRNQMAHDHYISRDKPMEQIMQEVLDYIAINSPAIEKHYVLAGVDIFDIKAIDFDDENDPIIERKFQYVQDANYFDNPTGMENFAAASFSENSNWVDTKVGKFNEVGEFRIFRRIKDQPSPDPNFANYSYFSGTPELRVYAHRKPIAKASLEWDYDNSKGVYKTRWVCQSYDFDHQYSREDKGIAERKIMFRRTGGEWYYYVPEELSSGTYELQYYVKDIEGAWSDPFAMNFTLLSAPSIQFDAKLCTKDSKFSLNNIPASEDLEVYDAWTRYPYNVKLEMALYNGSIRISPVKSVNYSSSTGVKTGNDIQWNSISYQVPNTIKDGTYTFKVEAVDTNNSSIQAVKSFSVMVNTPINLVPSMPETVMTGNTADIKAATEKYASVTRVAMFYGTSYEQNLELSSVLQEDMKEWSNKYTIPSNIPEGVYTARFISTTQNGKSEMKDATFKVETLKISKVTIEGYWNHWRGQVDMFGRQLANEPHRFLSLERVKINVQTDGFADKVEIRFSPELEAMRYRDQYNNWYDQKEDFGIDYTSFPKTFMLDNTKKENQIYWEYVLPLTESTKSWEDKRLKNAYYMEVTLWKGEKSVKYVIDNIDITGNIYDLTYIQPV